MRVYRVILDIMVSGSSEEEVSDRIWDLLQDKPQILKYEKKQIELWD